MESPVGMARIIVKVESFRCQDPICEHEFEKVIREPSAVLSAKCRVRFNGNRPAHCGYLPKLLCHLANACPHLKDVSLQHIMEFR